MERYKEMTDENNNGIWVFLSHSNKDYEKVRLVRNRLEEKQLRPLMFFLHCLNDEEELDSLIKREIDCRTRFILCDSENAKKSKWVQKEVDYILSKDRICETIDLSKPVDDIMDLLDDFVNKTRLFFSYNREEYKTAKSVYDRLIQYDFSVYIDTFYDSESPYQQCYLDTINEIENNVESGGYVVSIMNDRILDCYGSCSRMELIKAIKDNLRRGNKIPNIIPFVTQESLIDRIEQDIDLHVLSDCGLQCIEGLSMDLKCDVIVKGVVTKLMTLGSIRAQADNFAKGINCNVNKKEADFLYGLLDNYK